jgi:hypothetical protein
LTITWNGEPLVDDEQEVLEALYFKDESGEKTRWEVDFEIELDNGLEVGGYACLFSKFNRQLTGLTYFWRSRLIQGNIEPYYRPKELFGSGNSFRTGRLYIELYADEFDVTSDKKAIDFGASKTSEGEVLEKIKEILTKTEFPLLQQGENYRSGQSGTDLHLNVNATLEIAKETAEAHGETFLRNVMSPDEPDPVYGGDIQETAFKTLEVLAERTIRHNYNGSNVSFKVSCVDGSKLDPWIDIEWDTRRDATHNVLINMQHIFVKKYLSTETVPIFIGLAVSTVYGEFKARALTNSDELVLVRHFTDSFLRYMANYEERVDYDDED